MFWVGGGFSKWMRWAVIFLGLQPTLTWFQFFGAPVFFATLILFAAGQMDGFGFDKLLLVLVIVLVLFGARRVPEIGASIGKGIREFKRGMHELNPEAEDDANRSNHVASPVEASQDTNVEPKRLLER